MSEICPFCSHTLGTYAEIDHCQTLVGGVVSIVFWLCYKCSQATALQPTSLDNLSREEFSRLAEYFKKEREYTLRSYPRRQEIAAPNCHLSHQGGASHV